MGPVSFYYRHWYAVVCQYIQKLLEITLLSYSDVNTMQGHSFSAITYDSDLLKKHIKMGKGTPSDERDQLTLHKSLCVLHEICVVNMYEIK